MLTKGNSGGGLVTGPRITAEMEREAMAESKRVKVEILRGTIIDGVHKNPGDVVEVAEHFAKEFLFRTRKARPAPVAHPGTKKGEQEVEKKEAASGQPQTATNEPPLNAAKRTGKTQGPRAGGKGK